MSLALQLQENYYNLKLLKILIYFDSTLWTTQWSDLILSTSIFLGKKVEPDFPDLFQPDFNILQRISRGR